MSWFAILRLGMVNAALGAVVALVTFTLNRVMTVELALPALLPGALVALHYAVQLLRPRLGFAGDESGRRTPWILGGLAVLCAGGALASVAVSVMAGHAWFGVLLAVVAYAMVGAGAGAVGTSSLALMATQVSSARRPAAATVFWLLMIVGAVFSAALCSQLLHPFSLRLLVRVSVWLTAGGFLVGTLAISGVEASVSHTPQAARPSFRLALAETWREPESRRFAMFVFVAMLAYSAQELILEPFAGAVLQLSPAQTAFLTGQHQSGVLLGMVLVAVAGSLAGNGRARVMRLFTGGGCVASSACLLSLAWAGIVGHAWPIGALVLALGVGNGAFAVSAIGAMLGLAGQGRAGTRMGLWGAAQALAMGLGGLLATGASDAAHAMLGTPAAAYAAVFMGQAGLFLIAARLASRVFAGGAGRRAAPDTQLSLGVAA